MIFAAAVLGFGWPWTLLVVPVAVFGTFAASVVKLRAASRKIDSIFAEELSESAAADQEGEETPERGDAAA
ncbi:hypothetical protein [Amycolatopsis sp. Hca4]|uniref:hypothetical protein n=1 Tax=unclassified Amycolatopsis TaxID=2618356 RepID=UPI0020CACAFE|nr:hypothetical protein [Amycolatopsis sp. Hca4]